MHFLFFDINEKWLKSINLQVFFLLKFASPLIFIKIILTFFRYFIICIFLDSSLMISHVLHVRKHLREDGVGMRRSIDFRCLFLCYSIAHSIGAFMTISKLYFDSKKKYKSFLESSVEF